MNSNPVNLIDLQPKNIIVRMPNWLGDLVMSTPILHDLRSKWPEAKITVVCQNVLSVIVQEDPNINEVVTFKTSKKQKRESIKEYLSLLRKGNYDLGILLTNSFSTAWLFWRGHVQTRVGFAANWRSFLLNHAIPFPLEIKNQHLVKTYKELLVPFGISISSSSPQLYVTEQERKEAQESLKQWGISKSDILIGVNPGAAYGSAKCWLPERFKELTDILLKHPKVKVLYFGDKAGQSLVDMICEGMPERVINLAGKTHLRQLLALIQACHLFLTNDSGPMHVASALNVPLIALFGSTSDIATSPYKGGLVIHKHVKCSPCYRRECPIDFRCMKEISVEEVYQKIKNWMNDNELIE